jgi:hypothetical protein
MPVNASLIIGSMQLPLVNDWCDARQWQWHATMLRNLGCATVVHLSSTSSAHALDARMQQANAGHWPANGWHVATCTDTYLNSTWCYPIVAIICNLHATSSQIATSSCWDTRPCPMCSAACRQLPHIANAYVAGSHIELCCS